MNIPASGGKTIHFFRLITLAKRLFRLFRDPRTPKTAKALLIGAAFYVLVPVDFLPEWIPVLGVMDDLGVAVLVTTLALRLVPDDVKRRHGLLK